MLLSLFVVPVHAASKFTDVADTAYYANSVVWAVNKGITTGKTDTIFAPNEQCTKAQIITFLWRAFGSPEPTESDFERADALQAYPNHNPFTDLNGSEYYFKAAQWMYYTLDLGIGSSPFNGNEPCTRKYAVMYMWTTAGSPDVSTFPNFTDAPDGVAFRKAMAWAVDKGITNGTTETTFSPETICTRAQIVTFLYRYLGNNQVTQQTTAESLQSETGLAGWKQSPNGTWYLGDHDPNISASTPAASQPTGPISSREDLTDEQLDRAGEAARKIYAGESQLKWDEEGGFYYYEW